jgi:hypothetical protein
MHHVPHKVVFQSSGFKRQTLSPGKQELVKSGAIVEHLQVHGAID